ncbi:PPOX class F420-dependent oxidoreductase [Gordonia sp. HY002]|uniref:PPOX class F420-dependent oxidoreductase n=1 Tax=Gordonia zhenghanii TaxID=2911516 RepID=UPI001EF12D86|nr:PPOX class F420-dependent oxidoreductase [Gordonia zhenghanii]MCF8571077.1 PPOX class F420-dependent oxidoreductase [Gordonia zhenghanii]MCF8606232.1 PPOX class F420-dependent oxidoreductase [Gordonia zhenghanii]
MTTVGEIAEAKYVMLTTYRKTGEAVASPLWAVRDGNDLVMWTVRDSWKVKRLRRDNRVLVQKCDARGSKTVGPQVAGIGTVNDDGSRAGDMIIKKYGIFGRLTVLGSRLRRGAAGTVEVRVHDVV